MFTLASEQQAVDDGDDSLRSYTRSYLLMRTVVGILGLLLPVSLLLGEAFFLRGGLRARGSLSAYYHTSMRDLFVGILCMTGVLLITYMAAKPKSAEFVVSSIAGAALLGVAFLPTGRPDLAEGATRCGPGADPVPAGCTALQQTFGETAVAAVHFTCAFVFIVALILVCQAFVRSDEQRDATKARAHVHRWCRNLIAAALAWIVVGGLLGADVAGLTPLYLGEVVSVLAFGVAWLIKGHDLAAQLRLLVPGRARRTSEHPAV